MTDATHEAVPPVGEAAERLRAALADLAAGQKVKLFPADVRALLDHYDRRADPAEPDEPGARREQPAEDGSRLSQVTDSLLGLRGALDKMGRPGFDTQLLGVLLPFGDAILGLLNHEIDKMKQEKVDKANDAYKAVAAAEDDKDGSEY